MRKAASALAAAAAFIVFSPAHAQTNGAPVCGGTFEDPQTNTGSYADVGFIAADFCADPEGDQITITSISWGPGWQLSGDQTEAILWQLGPGQESIPITVTDGQGNYTTFNWVVIR